MGTPPYDSKGDAHREDPGAGNDGVAVFFAPVHEALVGGFLACLLGAQPAGFILVVFFGVSSFFEGAGEVVGCYDCWMGQESVSKRGWRDGSVFPFILCFRRLLAPTHGSMARAVRPVGFLTPSFYFPRNCCSFLGE